MSRLPIYLNEALREFRQTVSGPQIPLMVLGLVGYLLIVVTRADYMREMGAADITRNSPHLVYLMTTGEGFWLAFAFAWVFAQIVTRDQDAKLHEIVLAAPVSLHGLLVARFAGAFLVACMLGLATPLAFLLVPSLESIGALPAGSVGPTPWHAIVWSFGVFVIPTALGLGALYTAIAIRTRSVAGPFAAAAAVAIVWMVAMVIIRGGGLDRELATWLDPTAYAEAEHQAERWTPAEKMSSLLAFTAPLAVNRLLWTVTPLVYFVWTLTRLHRESLTIGRARKARSSRRSRPVPPAEGPIPARAFTARSWWRGALSEAVWHFALSTRGWGFRLIAFLLFVVGVAGSVVHLVAHIDGPFVPRPEVLTPLLADFSFVGIVFVIAGLVGVMARRDDCLGFVEISDSAPAPIWVRVVGRTFAAAMLTLILACVPMLSGWVVTAVFAPESFSLVTPFSFAMLSFFPGLLEVCAITLLVHALIRSAGVAHALTMLLAFIAVINHEVSLVSYPPYQVAIPTHVTLSELTGFGAWWGPVLVADAFKLGIVALCISGAWIAWRRGTAQTVTDRIALAARRVRAGAGVLGVAAMALLFASGSVLHDRLVVRGEFANVEEERREQAEWERRWWRHAASFSVRGGEFAAVLHPSTREFEAKWLLYGVRSDTHQIHLGLPHGVTLDGARSSRGALQAEEAFDHAVVHLGSCDPDCDVELSLSGRLDGWPVDDRQPWISRAGVDARASDFVPMLGHDAARVLRGEAVRAAHGLPPVGRSHLPRAFRSAHGVAPVGDWKVEIVVDDTERTVVLSEVRRGPLDFAVAWPSERTQKTVRGPLAAHHGPTHAATATELLEDTEAMKVCVEEALGQRVDVSVVHQAPRALGPLAVHGTTLWVPEDEGWDAGSLGVSRWQRRAEVAQALAAYALASDANLRTEPGFRWLTDGLAGWIGLECVRMHDGTEAWQALMERKSDRIVEALGALDAPIVGFASDGEADWVPEYAPLAAQGWAMSLGKDAAIRRVAELRASLQEGQSVVDALQQTLGMRQAAVILGPPHASDVSVGETDAGIVLARGSRWTWGGGGWRDRSNVDRFIGVADESDEAFRALDPSSALDGRNTVAVFDAWPSFERALQDNFRVEGSDDAGGPR